MIETTDSITKLHRVVSYWWQKTR